MGHAPEQVHVEVGDYEGIVASAEALQDDITEGMWRSGDSISVSMRTKDNGPNLLVLVGTNYVAPLIVTYHGGSLQERETLRAAVERQLPESSPGRWCRSFVLMSSVMLVWRLRPR